MYGVELSQDRLKELLHYDPETGIFIWIIGRGNQTAKEGGIAGYICTNTDGYKYYRIKIQGKGYTASRLAWLYMTGEWPKVDIDHQNRNGLDNKWDNLREATKLQNVINRKLPSKKGLPRGVNQIGNKFIARIGIHGDRKYLGSYSTKEEAANVYKIAATSEFGEFTFLY